MSKVKQSLDEAKEFASSAQTDPGAVEGAEAALYTPPPIPSYIVDADGNPVAYQTEQQLINIRLSAAVATVEADAVALIVANTDRIKGMKKASDDFQHRRTPASAEYRKVFAWPILADATLDQLHEQLSLTVSTSEIERCSNAASEASKLSSASSGFLMELGKIVDSLRAKNDIQRQLQAFNTLLLEDTTITQETLIEIHDLAQGDVFAFLRSQLAPLQRGIENLRDDLSRTLQAKADAELVDDFEAVEKASYRIVDISAQVITKISERLKEIFTSDADIRAFCEKYEAVRSGAGMLLEKQEGTLHERASQLASDLAALSKARVQKETEDARLSEGHQKRMEAIGQDIASTNTKQAAAWDIIFERMDEIRELAAKRQGLVEQQLRSHSEESQRSAQTQAWLRGVENYVSRCKHSNDFTTLGITWTASIRTYVDNICTVIENKNVDEEAWQIRVQEQLDYLDAYKEHKIHADEISHRKELRVQSLHRLSRNLQLQIQEASTVLDPNTKRYERELEEIKVEIARTTEQLSALADRGKIQHREWKVIEEQLEDAQVDFFPPDISVEQEMCRKRAEALSVVRTFVSNEQEHVDKDTMKLRKIKTSNQVSIDGLKKRRDERNKEQADNAAHRIGDHEELERAVGESSISRDEHNPNRVTFK